MIGHSHAAISALFREISWVDVMHACSIKICVSVHFIAPAASNRQFGSCQTACYLSRIPERSQTFLSSWVIKPASTAHLTMFALSSSTSGIRVFSHHLNSNRSWRSYLYAYRAQPLASWLEPSAYARRSLPAISHTNVVARHSKPAVCHRSMWTLATRKEAITSTPQPLHRRARIQTTQHIRSIRITGSGLPNWEASWAMR